MEFVGQAPAVFAGRRRHRKEIDASNRREFSMR